MQRCAVLCAGFGKHERAAGKIEGCQTLAARQLCVWRPPVQPASNHQVQHQPEIALYSNRNSLADSPQLAHDAALHIRNRGLRGSKQKGARQPHSIDRLCDDARFECKDVGGDIRQFRHADQLAGRACAFATSFFWRREITGAYSGLATAGSEVMLPLWGRLYITSGWPTSRTRDRRSQRRSRKALG